MIPVSSFDKHWRLYSKFIGRAPRDLSIPKRDPRNHRRIAVICDLHGAPYQPMVKKVLTEDYDILALDGDLVDAFAFSPFPKMPGRVISINDEIANVRAFIEAAVENGAKVIVNEGNHERRVWLAYKKHLPEEYLPLVNYNILELLTAKIPNTSIAHNVYDFTSGAGTVTKQAFSTDWLIQLGDAMLGHVDIAKKDAGRSADAFANYVQKWRRAMGWDEPRLLIQAHVHKANIDYAEGGHRVFVEGGVAGCPNMFQYMMDKGGGRGVPPPLGYVEFAQDRKRAGWVTDLQSVRFVMC